MVDKKHIIGLGLAFIVLVIIGMVLLWPKLTSSTDHHPQPKVQHRKQANHTFFPISSTTSKPNVHQPKKEKTVNESSVNESSSKCSGKELEWSVRVEACTKNIGSPYRVIKEWQLSKRKNENMREKFNLTRNGSFFINERGMYNIYTKVTFKNKENNYVVDIPGSSRDNKIHFNRHNSTVDGNQVIVYDFCGDITEKLSFFLRLLNTSLVYLFPDKTYFTVKKFK